MIDKEKCNVCPHQDKPECFNAIKKELVLGAKELIANNPEDTANVVLGLLKEVAEERKIARPIYCENINKVKVSLKEFPEMKGHV